MKTHKVIAIASAGAILLYYGIAFAQQDTSNLGAGQSMRAQRLDIKDAIKNAQQNFKMQIKDLQQETKDKMKSATSSFERGNIIKNAKDERKGILDNRKASTTAMRTQFKELVRRQFGVTIQRFSVALKQFDNLASRIQSRIDKMKGLGIDTSSVETSFATAKSAIETARADAKAVADIVAQVTNASDKKTVHSQIEVAVKKANESVKAAHKALEATSKALVSVARAQQSHATSTRNND